MLGSIQSRGNQQFGTEKTKTDVNSLLRKLFPGTKRTIQKAHKGSVMSFSQFIKADPSILFKLENRNVIEGNIKATVSSDSISSLGEINKSSNLKPSDEVTKSNFWKLFRWNISYLWESIELH